MGINEKVMLFGIGVLVVQLTVLLLLIWRSKKTYLLLGYQLELVFWLVVGVSTTVAHNSNIATVAPVVTVLVFIRTFTNAIMYMGDPDKAKERWSFINDIERKHKE